MASNSNPTSPSVQPARQHPVIIHEGWLQKCGSKNLKYRYFILFSDGGLLGFKKPRARGDYSSPVKTYTVTTVLELNDPASTKFTIKGVKSSKVIERTFSANNVFDREKWYEALQKVAARDKDPVMHAEKSEVSISSTAMEPGIHGLKPNVTFKDFDFVRFLGSGANGQVLLGKERKSGKFYAVKMLKKKSVVKMDQIVNESRVLFVCKHQFVTSMAYAFKTAGHVCFVMDFGIGGDLRHHLADTRETDGKYFDINRTRFYAAEIACGLGHLHYHGMVYRDLKLENVLLDRSGHVKLVDFGLCAENFDDQNRLRSFCGTPEYMAPEVLDVKCEGYGRAVDWWALGIVVYEMIYGLSPFFETDQFEIYRLIREEPVTFPTPSDPVTQAFIRHLLQKNQKERLGSGPGDIRDVQDHAFFKDMDWAKLHRFEVKPPFAPDLKDETDTKYFDKDILSKEIKLTDFDDDDDVTWDQRFQRHQMRRFLSSVDNLEATNTEEDFFRDLFRDNPECRKAFTAFSFHPARKG
uniref:Non-specific serine/threonine protein kinase n=1 Tax=Panagrellus redivivus TaxID=6233 RepID=A0A7E4VZ52_PANRE